MIHALLYMHKMIMLKAASPELSNQKRHIMLAECSFGVHRQSYLLGSQIVMTKNQEV